MKKSLRNASFRCLFTLGLLTAGSNLAFSQFQTLNHKAPFTAGTALLLTDGTVIVQGASTSWYKLTPDITGSYLNGTWSQIASLPSNYDPLYFASAVLPDGRVVINGGEYNFGSQVETNLGAIYNPTANTWTALAGPTGWTEIGDAMSVILPNGTYMLGNCCGSNQALLDATTLTWTTTGTGKADPNAEEGWTLLPDGTVLTVDVESNTDDRSERYNPKNGKWSSAGSTIVDLASSSLEMGPAVLRPDGTVFNAGATKYTSVYHPGASGAVGTWIPGPDFPNMTGVGQLDIADGPAALLPDGNVLMVASPGSYETNSFFFEFDGSNLNPVPGTPNAPSDSSYYFRMLVLPTGQILTTDGSDDVELYTSTGTYETAWAPVITAVSKTLTHGTTYGIEGTLFNGVSQGASYGDDAQSATNFPLVRVTNAATGHVFYCRTHNHTSMAVANPNTVGTHFDVPSGIETGASTLVVVANGIPSTPVNVTIN